ncbi:MAG: glycosyltransferase family 4 protein [Terriglobales bacterium]|jgi:glycosyltransferase involved in cell wall biosynthesis
MTTVAYIANEFPSPVEPYVMDEIAELRRCGVNVVCCSGKRVAPNGLSLAERAYWKETRYFQPLTDDALMRAAGRLASDRRNLWRILRPLLLDGGGSPGLRIRALGHTLMGSAMAEELAPLNVQHIHAHHGYFASWMALVASRLLGIGFSFTLHGSDLLHRADLLTTKLEACSFCATISDFNRNYILRKYPTVPATKIIVQRLGVDRVLSWPTDASPNATDHRPFCLLAVGRLHRVKDYDFLIRACSALREQGLDFLCWIVGEGPERSALERQVRKLGLRGHVHLSGHVPRADLAAYYRYADLVAITSKSEGIPVVLMEAMSQQKLVLAPDITGIPELVEHQQTGFLYQRGSLPSFINAVNWIYANQSSLSGIRRAAAAKVATSYNRPRNLLAFAEQFLSRISPSGGEHAHSLLQQV